MSWIRRNLRGTKVYVRTRPDGAIAVDSSGRVDVKYRLEESAKIYRASARNLAETGDPADDEPAPDVETGPAPHPANAIVVYTDGACSGNPGPMGIGLVVIDGSSRHEVSEFLGQGTNNIAELVAIERALDVLSDVLTDLSRPVLVHTDSS